MPLSDEPGLELVPGSHKRWDSGEELDVRLEREGRRNYEDLSTGERVKLSTGDLLVFSANMIHRGIYGMDRLSLDILFCDPDPGVLEYVRDSCLPDLEMMRNLENTDAFRRSLESKSKLRP